MYSPASTRNPVSPKPPDDLIGSFGRRESVQPAVVVVEPSRLVDRRQHRQVVQLAELEVLTPAPGRDVDESRPLVHRDVLPWDDAVFDLRAGREIVERTLVAPADELVARRRSTKVSSAFSSTATHSPFSRRPYSLSGCTATATLAGSVHGVVVQMTSDSPSRSAAGSERRVTGRRDPDRRRPGSARAARAMSQTGAPFGRPVTFDQHASRVHELEELPDVFDVRIAEGEVVVAPVHPLPEALRAARERGRRTKRRRRGTPGRTPRALYSSISGLEFSPSARSTPTSIQSPWQSKPFW